MPLHLSLAYSPITLLQRKKVFGRAVDRRNLAEVKVYLTVSRKILTQYQLCQSLGDSERPQALVTIESIIWSNLFKLADCLLTVEEVLENIFRDTAPYIDVLSDADNRFYSNCLYIFSDA